MKFETKSRIEAWRRSDQGLTLLELMISMLILATGLGALTTLVIMAISSDNRNGKDTTATLLAQMVIEQISAQHPASNTSISVTDCAGNNWTIATQGGTSPTGTGATLVTSSSQSGYGGIDQTQSVSSVPAGYAMQFVDCTTNGPRTVYDVRWNVMNIDPEYTRLITASARMLSAPSNQLGSNIFAVPVTLRSVGAP